MLKNDEVLQGVMAQATLMMMNPRKMDLDHLQVGACVIFHRLKAKSGNGELPGRDDPIWNHLERVLMPEDPRWFVRAVKGLVIRGKYPCISVREGKSSFVFKMIDGLVSE